MPPFYETVMEFFSNSPIPFSQVIYTVIILIAIIIISKMVKRSIKKYSSEQIDKHLEKSTYTIIRIIIYIIALIALLKVWGIAPGGLLAGAGVMGIILGFAAQQTIGNIIGGILMMFSRPFSIGDWIEVDGDSGTVKDIKLIHTTIETFDGEEVSIPNNVISSSTINNLSKRGKLRIKETIGIDYDSDPEKAKEIAEEEMKEHPDTASDPEPRAYVNELADSSINLEILCWIDNPAPKKRRKVLHDLIISIKRRYNENGIGIPFPHAELLQHENQDWSFKKK